jgi:hypothetical protein
LAESQRLKIYPGSPQSGLFLEFSRRIFPDGSEKDELTQQA